MNIKWKPGGGGGGGMCSWYVRVSQCTVCETHMYMHIAMETGNHSCGNLMLPNHGNLKKMPHFIVMENYCSTSLLIFLPKTWKQEIQNIPLFHKVSNKLCDLCR